MKRFCQRAFLKPEKIEEYRKLHAAVWPDVLKTIHECNLRNYSISIMGDMVVSYFEYIGDNYDADMEKMAEDPITQKWWTHTHPCFRDHEKGVYYEDLEEIFYYA